jgi:hypothetical protein
MKIIILTFFLLTIEISNLQPNSCDKIERYQLSQNGKSFEIRVNNPYEYAHSPNCYTSVVGSWRVGNSIQSNTVIDYDSAYMLQFKLLPTTLKFLNSKSEEVFYSYWIPSGFENSEVNFGTINLKGKVQKAKTVLVYDEETMSYHLNSGCLKDSLATLSLSNMEIQDRYSEIVSAMTENIKKDGSLLVID